MARKINNNPKTYFQYDFLGNLYAGDAEKVGKYGFPQLREENWVPTKNVRPFNYLLSMDNPGDWWIHCFCDDYQFERLWNNFYAYKDIILRAKGFISTDFSLFRDYSEEQLRWNCYRNRVIAYAIQKEGGTVIPTAGFAGENTWSWCFDGLPHNSSVAITTNGTRSDPEAKRLFVGGIDAMVKTISPKAIIVCGKYPEWLNDKYPGIEIVPIQSYSQMWQERRCS